MNFQMNKLLKQAQEMQKKMQEAQQELAKLEVCGEAGGGMVKIYMNGQNHVTRVEISPEALPNVSEDERQILEDLFLSAFHAATQKANEASRTKLSGLTTGLNLPEGFGGLE